MAISSRHISVVIERAPADVYEFAVEPTNLPRWASGLAGAEVHHDGDGWWTDSPMGRVFFSFAPRNDFGILDHDVTLPDGAVVNNPMRVSTHPEGSEVVFTVRQLPGMADEEFDRDARMVAEDLATLKALLEAPG